MPSQTHYLVQSHSDKLTITEAKALLYAVGNTTDCPDAMLALFPDVRERQAAMRAVDKISRVYHRKVRALKERGISLPWEAKQKRKEEKAQGQNL